MSGTVRAWSPIVGAYHRPPALALLAGLPAGTELWLEPEPGNEWDPNAIRVEVAGQVVERLSEEQATALAGELMRYGVNLAELIQQPRWHLGYVPSSKNGKALASGGDCNLVLGQKLALAQSVHGQDSICWKARLGFEPSGAPMVEVEIQGAPAGAGA